MVACSVLIGMNRAYSPSTSPCRARTPNQPAPKVGRPFPMSTTAMRSRAVGAADSSGRGRTAAMASGSVSNTTVTALDQIGLLVASTSRLDCASTGRAP